MWIVADRKGAIRIPFINGASALFPDLDELVGGDVDLAGDLTRRPVDLEGGHDLGAAKPEVKARVLR